jgi:hypothetical protein
MVHLNLVCQPSSSRFFTNFKTERYPLATQAPSKDLQNQLFWQAWFQHPAYSSFYEELKQQIVC